MLGNLKLVHLITTVLATLVLLNNIAAQQATTIIIAAGQEDGSYYKIAQTLSQEQAMSAQFDVLKTGGSVENIALLESGKADFAFAQSDIALRAVRSHQPFDHPVANLSIVTPLFTEAVQPLVRSDLFLFAVSDLRGKIISLGPEQSGTEITARALLEASGIALEDIQSRHVSFDKLDNELRNESVDAGFIISAVPTAPVATVLSRQDGRLLFIDAKVIERLVKSGSYTQTVIPKGTYSNQPDEITSVGVQALLLARRDVDPAKVRLIMQTLYGHRSELQQRVGVHLDLLGRAPPANLNIPINATSRPYLANTVSHTWLVIVLLLVILGCGLAVGVFHRHRLRRTIAIHTKIILSIIIAVAAYIVSVVGLYRYEGNVNENFATLGKSAWSLLVYISGGFQSRVPLTSGGETVAVVAIICGVAIIAWFIAQLATYFVKSEIEKLKDFLLRRNHVPAKVNDHIVIVNWNRQAEQIVEQLHGSDIIEKRMIVIITPDDRVALPGTRAFNGCIVVCGDATDHGLLTEARISAAHSVVILSGWSSPKEARAASAADPDVADAKVILTIIAIRSLSSELSKPEHARVSITAEVLNGKNLAAARTAGRGGRTEVICAESVGANIFAQCALTPGLAAVFEDLLTFAPNTDEIYKVRVPRPYQGKLFSEVMHDLADRTSKADAVIPLGVFRAPDVYLNPGPEIGALRSDDYLFVICDHENTIDRSLADRAKAGAAADSRRK
jgi:uncharacterized protein